MTTIVATQTKDCFLYTVVKSWHFFKMCCQHICTVQCLAMDSTKIKVIARQYLTDRSTWILLVKCMCTNCNCKDQKFYVYHSYFVSVAVLLLLTWVSASKIIEMSPAKDLYSAVTTIEPYQTFWCIYTHRHTGYIWILALKNRPLFGNPWFHFAKITKTSS